MFNKLLGKALGFKDEDEIFGVGQAGVPDPPEIMGGMGDDLTHGADPFDDEPGRWHSSMNTTVPAPMKLPGGPVVPGVDRATGMPYKPIQPTQRQSATDYPGQGGMRGYPSQPGSEADRAAAAANGGVPPITSRPLPVKRPGMSKSLRDQGLDNQSASPASPVAPAAPGKGIPGMTGTTYVTADGRKYDFSKLHPRQYAQMIEMISNGVPLADRYLITP